MTKRREGRTKGGHQWLYYWILKALVEQGDEGTKHATTHLVLKEIEGELVDEDRHRVSTGETRIENYIAWARADLVAVDDGRMQAGTPIDAWKISDRGAEWLKNHGPQRRQITGVLGQTTW